MCAPWLLVSRSIDLVWAQDSYLSLVGVLVVGASLGVTRTPLLIRGLGWESKCGTLSLFVARLSCRRFRIYWSGSY